MITNAKIPVRSKNILLLGVLAFASIVSVVTAVRIEYLNHLSGGSIQRKAEQEPNSKWRGEEGFSRAYEKIEVEL
jgi:hypothetical protein